LRNKIDPVPLIMTTVSDYVELPNAIVAFCDTIYFGKIKKDQMIIS
jgi:hypothetical protein